MPRRLAPLLFSTLAAWAAAACGASYQSVYEGDVRFEHCYRLDAESNVGHASKLGCWRDWTKQYTRGQTRDRVEYALQRERELLSGDGHAVGPSVIAGASATITPVAAGSGPSIACPLPSSVFEAPPPTLPVATTTTAAPQPPVAALVSSAEPLTASQACVQDCGKSFTGCASKCKKTPCINKCGDLAKSCIGDCL